MSQCTISQNIRESYCPISTEIILFSSPSTICYETCIKSSPNLALQSRLACSLSRSYRVRCTLGGVNDVREGQRIYFARQFHVNNQRHSLWLFVVNSCLVWELLFLPSNAQTAPNSPSLKGARWRHWQGLISAD